MSEFPSLGLRTPRTLDLVHDNPGDAPYVTAFNDPQTLKSFGFESKVFMIFDSPQLAINWEGTSSKTPEIFYRAKPLRFRRDEQPLRIGGAVYVAVRPTASAIGVGVEGGDRKPLVLTRALDRLTYEPGHHSFVFNEAQKLMRNPSFSKGRNLFVPIELFRALVGDELYSR